VTDVPSTFRLPPDLNIGAFTRALQDDNIPQILAESRTW
jgi:hypothetical protein